MVKLSLGIWEILNLQKQGLNKNQIKQIENRLNTLSNSDFILDELYRFTEEIKNG